MFLKKEPYLNEGEEEGRTGKSSLGMACSASTSCAAAELKRGACYMMHISDKFEVGRGIKT